MLHITDLISHVIHRRWSWNGPRCGNFDGWAIFQKETRIGERVVNLQLFSKYRHKNQVDCQVEVLVVASSGFGVFSMGELVQVVFSLAMFNVLRYPHHDHHHDHYHRQTKTDLDPRTRAAYVELDGGMGCKPSLLC